VKKTLFSLAFVAASGVYVAAANHLLVPANDASPTLAEDAVAPIRPSAPQASTMPLVLPSQPAAIEAPKSIARAADPGQPVLPAPPSAPRITLSQPPAKPAAPLMANAAPVPLPPLPRPRPAPPAPVAVQPATSTDVAAAGSSGYRDGTYTGTDENAYYGRVQVQITIAGSQITAVKVLDYPQDRRTSRYINSQALPLLKQEVIAADSANIDTISGATLTSEAYIRSLANALGKAGGANA
jgi:uncharacterized protein with FMN-binding domain